MLNEKVFVVGHDWGATAGWYLSLFRPDRVKALVNLSAPYFQRSQTSGVVDYFRELFGDGCYVYQFQVYAYICICMWNTNHLSNSNISLYASLTRVCHLSLYICIHFKLWLIYNMKKKKCMRGYDWWSIKCNI